VSGSSIILDMVIDMNDAKRKTLAQVKAFVECSAWVEFQPAGDDRARYEHLGAALRLRHAQAPRQRPGAAVFSAHNGLHSRAQRGCLSAPRKGHPWSNVIAGRCAGLPISTRSRTWRCWPRPTRCTAPSRGRRPGGCWCALDLYGDRRYQRLAKISAAHLYNVRGQASYRDRRRQ